MHADMENRAGNESVRKDEKLWAGEERWREKDKVPQ